MTQRPDSEPAEGGSAEYWRTALRSATQIGTVPLSVLLVSVVLEPMTGALSPQRLVATEEGTDHTDRSEDAPEVLGSLLAGDSAARLSAARALRELSAIEQIRAALHAERDGATQREIGSRLGVSQTEVHRMLRRAKNANTDWIRVAPRELILRYRAGLISRGTLLGRLSDLADGQSASDGMDGYVHGEWDQVRDAFLDGLLTDEEYEALRAGSTRAAPMPSLAEDTGPDTTGDGPC